MTNITKETIEAYIAHKKISPEAKSVYRCVLNSVHTFAVKENLGDNIPVLLSKYLSTKTGKTMMRDNSILNDFVNFQIKPRDESIPEPAKTLKPMGIIREPVSESMEILPFTVDNFILQSVPKYIPEDAEELKFFDSMLNCGKHVLIIGEKGIGKSLSVAAWAHERGHPIVSFECAESAKAGDLEGKMIPRGDGKVGFKLGCIPLAIELANKSPTKCAILNMEEINGLNQFIQKKLNAILDWRHGIYVSDLNRTYRLNEGHKLIIIATCNPSHYGGTNQLNEDLKSRFTKHIKEYPDEKQEAKIINAEDMDADLVKGVLTLAKDTRNAKLSGDIEYALSPRDLAMFFTVLRQLRQDGFKYPQKLSIERCILSNYEDPEHRKFVQQRINSAIPEDR